MERERSKMSQQKAGLQTRGASLMAVDSPRCLEGEFASSMVNLGRGVRFA